MGGGGHVTDSDNTKVKHFAPINSNNDLCCIRKEREGLCNCFKNCFLNLIVVVVCVLFRTFRDYS